GDVPKSGSWITLPLTDACPEKLTASAGPPAPTAPLTAAVTVLLEETMPAGTASRGRAAPRGGTAPAAAIAPRGGTAGGATPAAGWAPVGPLAHHSPATSTAPMVSSTAIQGLCMRFMIRSISWVAPSQKAVGRMSVGATKVTPCGVGI